MKKITIAVAILLLCAAAGVLAQTREQTTIQTASAEVGKTKQPVEVRYLNLPWGPVSFESIEKGAKNYYGERPWPFAHLTTKAALRIGSSKLEAGDYVLVIHPGRDGAKMQLSIESFKPGENGTFLKPGDIFTKVPEDAKSFYKAPITFTKDPSLVDHMKIEWISGKGKLKMAVAYGDRRLELPFVASK